MLTDKQMEDALKVFQNRMQDVTDLYYRKMGEHIRDIGQLAPSDVHRLQQLRRMNRNLSEVKRRLAQAADMNVRDIEKILAQAAKADDRVIRKITGITDASVALPNNVPLQRALRAQTAETRGRLRNLSNTTANQSAYRKAVDAAVTAVQSGAEDYESAVRRTLRQAGALGLRVRDGGTSAVEYASGHTRRVDTAVRMNVLDAMRRMNQRVMAEVGEQFGANGVEIDAHMLCAEDHLPYQGQQFTNEEFEQIQDSLDRPFGEWNCRHTWAPIIVGVSPRAYTDEDVERFARFSTEEIEIDGTTKTRYEWSQAMRRMETAIREKKDTATLARYAGDESLRRECQGSVNAMVKAYERLSDRTGLGPDYRRTFVAGFRDVSIKKLQKEAKSGIISIEVDEMTPCLRKNSTGELVDTTVSLISPTKATCRGWEFDWTRPERNGFSVYALRVKGERAIQGMIAMKDDPRNYAINIDIVEAAPQNNPHNPRNTSGIKEYNGVGGHLFAEACRRSFEKGYGGYVYFTAKTNLIRHYEAELGAELLNPGLRTMAIDGRAALDLVNKYYGGEK